VKAIELAGIGKSFRRKRQTVEALRNVTLEVSQGEVFGFVGPNGAGKSTTIKVILDIISDYRGEARIFGCSARKAEARRHVGYVPESPRALRSAFSAGDPSFRDGHAQNQAR
jgi:ABC-2 type transport system ATP-binding protein